MASGVEPELRDLVEGMAAFMDGVMGLITDLVRAHTELVDVVEHLDRELGLLSVAHDGNGRDQSMRVVLGEARPAAGRERGALARAARAGAAIRGARATT